MNGDAQHPFSGHAAAWWACAQGIHALQYMHYTGAFMGITYGIHFHRRPCPNLTISLLSRPFSRRWILCTKGTGMLRLAQPSGCTGAFLACLHSSICISGWVCLAMPALGTPIDVSCHDHTRNCLAQLGSVAVPAQDLPSTHPTMIHVHHMHSHVDTASNQS